MTKLPNNFLELSAADRRRILVGISVDNFEAGDRDAWYHLLMSSVSYDPDIPEPTKANLRRLLIFAIQGKGDIDKRSKKYRAKEQEDEDIYLGLIQIGGSLKDAGNELAKRRAQSFSTIRLAYDRHTKSYPFCKRLDGRRKG